MRRMWPWLRDSEVNTTTKPFIELSRSYLKQMFYVNKTKYLKLRRIDEICSENNEVNERAKICGPE